MAQLAIKNLSKLAPIAGGPWNLPHKFHLYLIWVYGFKEELLIDFHKMDSSFISHMASK